MQGIDIFLVEDDISLLEVTRDFLEDNGYSVKTCSKGSEALEVIKEISFKLIILDINLPDIIGFDVCRIIRKTLKVPVIFLSARISDTDKITGLDLGADDYISKPYSLNELLSRIKANLRRRYDYDNHLDLAAQDEPLKKDETESFSFGNIIVDFEGRKVTVAGIEKDFPAKEFDLLAYLIKNRNKSIAKETLYNEIWGFDSIGEINTLSVHIRRIREKIEEDPSKPKYVKTVWSFGFRFEV
jgi:DNA-binding response OmpR family regulator